MHASNTAARAHDFADDSCQKGADIQLCCRCVSNRSAEEGCSLLTTSSPSVIAATTTAYTRASERRAYGDLFRWPWGWHGGISVRV